MPKPSPWCAGLLLLAPALAAAHSISDEVGGAVTQPTVQNPRSGNLYNILSGSFDLSDAFTLGVDLGLTLDPPMRAQGGASFGSSGGRVLNGALLLDFLPSEHFLLGVSLDFSPRSRTESATTVLFTNSLGTLVTADALLRSTSSSFGAGLTASYATAGESNLEFTFDGAVGFSRDNTVQSISSIETPRGMVQADEVIRSCENATTLSLETLCRSLLPVLRAEPSTLSQLRLSLGVTATLFEDTDIGLGGTLYLYDRDPTRVGYFSLMAMGRMVLLGNGMAVAPILFTASPALSHRFGNLSADLSYQYSRYLADLGSGHAFSLRLAYRFSQGFQLWLRPGLQLDVQPGAEPIRSFALSAGVRFSF